MDARPRPKLLPLELRVNGDGYSVAVPARRTLTELLRYDLGLTGTKQGCDKGDCGACTVLLDGEPVMSCITLALEADGREVTTVEGLARGAELDVLQRAFVEHGATQCGFCTPGMLVSGSAWLRRGAPTSAAQAISGNLCRCTGYTKILAALEAARDGAVGEVAAAEPDIAGEPDRDVAGEPAHEREGARERRARGKVGAREAVTGQLSFTDDRTLPGMLHAKLVRSPHANARVLEVDASEALAIDGVHAVITGRDLPERYGILPWTRDEQALAEDHARHVGDAVACVAAVDELTARRAARAVRVRYEILPHVLDPEAALAEDAPKVNEAAKRGNVSKHVELAFGDVEQALAQSDACAEGEYFFEGTTHAALEPHCAIGVPEPDGVLTVISATQVPHYLHRELARVLELPEDRIRVVQPPVGGAFGGKSEPFDLEFCVAKLALCTGRPVKLLYTREEVFYAHRGRHPMKLHYRLGAMRDGTLTGCDARALIDGGAYSSFGLVTTYYSGQLVTAPLRLSAFRFESTRVFTNKPACGPKRGHGSVQPRFAFEVTLDRLADSLGLDPIAMRRKNAIEAGERTINELMVRSTGFVECLDRVEQASDWRAKHRRLPRGRGIGVAGSCYISGTNYPIYPNEMPQSAAHIKLDRSGRVTVFSGVSEIGQGADSMLANIVRRELGVEPQAIRVVSGDTDLCPVDLGAYSSRVTLMAGNACRRAAHALACKVRLAAAERWTVEPDEVLLADGWATRTAAGQPPERVPLFEAFRWAETRFGSLGAVGSYNTPKKGVHGDYRGATIGASPAYSFTAHVAEVTVDESSGVVQVDKLYVAHDCGHALDRAIVEGQIEGSAYMGFAEALLEAQLFHDSGLHRGPSLLDYAIPTSLDTPEIVAMIVEAHDPEGPYGAKEAGEGPLHPSIPAIANAIYDAVGVRIDTLPFSPATVLRALDQRDRRQPELTEVA